MTWRPHDWSPLAGSDPIPGDPDAVESAANRYTTVANNISTAAANLNRAATSTSGASSDAVKEFQTKADEVRNAILKAESRYRGLGSALATYAPHLRSAQDESYQALVQAVDARDSMNSANSLAAYYERQAKTYDQADDDEQARYYTNKATTAQNNADDASGKLALARQRLNNAITARDTAAQNATNAITDVQNSSPLNDSGWDKFRDWASDAMATVVDVLKTIGEWLDKFAIVLLIAQIVLMFIPGGAAIVALIRVVSMIAKAVSVVSTILKAAQCATMVLQAANGDISWQEAGIAVGAFALTLVAQAAMKPLFAGNKAGSVATARGKMTQSMTMSNVSQGIKTPGALASNRVNGLLGKAPDLRMWTTEQGFSGKAGAILTDVGKRFDVRQITAHSTYEVTALATIRNTVWTQFGRDAINTASLQYAGTHLSEWATNKLVSQTISFGKDQAIAATTP